MTRHHASIIAFTAFEPSGDALAAPIIAVLRRTWPQARVVAWGGPKMAAAGAELMERTAEDGTMGIGAIAKFRHLSSIKGRIRAWLNDHQAAVHVPVDSPAANFPIAKMFKQHSARIVHLVAPQVWAWGPWRIGKLHRTTDLVLCLLPFEEQWFRTRRVPAAFIGHPVVNRKLDVAALTEAASTLPGGSPKIALLPGSRTQEVRANLDLLLETASELGKRHPGMSAVIVAAREDLTELISEHMRGRNHRAGSDVDEGANPITITSGGVDPALAWCDLALTVSGTVTLDIVRHGKPMVGIYCTSRISAFLSRFLLTMPHRLLPNIIAGERIVPEFVPYGGSPQPIIEAADALLRDQNLRRRQQDAQAKVRSQYEGKQPATEAAKLIGQAAGLTIRPKRRPPAQSRWP